jgi:hypothetical protein
MLLDQPEDLIDTQPRKYKWFSSLLRPGQKSPTPARYHNSSGNRTPYYAERVYTDRLLNLLEKREVPCLSQ